MNPHELPLTTEILTDRSIAIKLVGVGGAGSNAVDRLKMENLERLQMAVINTDLQALSQSPVQEKLLIGKTVTRGLSAGGDPDLGREAAESDREQIANIVKDCHLIFLAVGMGGGTGSGAAPVVAEIASECGALVIAFAAMPFSFEGGRRSKQAEDGLAALRRVCDAVIPLPNDMLLQEAGDNDGVLNSFAVADEWIGRGVRSIWAMLFRTGLINLDFAGLRQAFQYRGGKTLFGLGSGMGENAVAETIESLKMCPLLHTPEFSRKADRLLVNIVGGTDLTLPKVNEIMTAVTDQFGRESNIIMGAVIDEGMQNRIDVCVIGTTDIGARSVRNVRPSGGTRVRPPVVSPVSPGQPVGQGQSEPVGRPVVGPAPSGRPVKVQDLPLSSGNEQLGLPVGGPKSGFSQEEFGFGQMEHRGSFDKTDRNLFEGQDLDVPTYLRKGIKISF